MEGRWREDGGMVDGMVKLKGKWNRVEGRKQNRKKWRRGGREEVIERSGIDLCNCPLSICFPFPCSPQHCVAVLVKPNHPRCWEPRPFTEISIPALLKDIDTIQEPSPDNWTLCCSRETKYLAMMGFV